MMSDYDYENFANIVAGEGDWFTAQLIRLAKKADGSNRKRLKRAFPEVVDALERWENSPYSVSVPKAERTERWATETELR